jgi:sigma-E factor negative regulatory protein RseA
MVILMHEELNQKISQFIDNELNQPEALSLLISIRSIPELNRQYNNYQTISQALKTDAVIAVKQDFVASISKKLQHEPTYFLTQRYTVKNNFTHLAIAASIIIVAIIIGYNMKVSKQESYTTTDFQLTENKKNDKANQLAKALEGPINQKINAYLQAHNIMSTKTEPLYQPYTRVSSYDQK